MGGLGSGGWNHSGRAAVEDTATLAMRRLARADGLRPGACTIWRWSSGGEPFASIGVHAGCDALRLRFVVTDGEGRERRVEEAVALCWRACRFGGRRALFQCPRCARVVLNLHLTGHRFVCRRCGGLTYASRRERERDRDLRAANKLRRRLGGDAGALAVVATRPRHMHGRTYERIVDEIVRREDRAMADLADWVMRLGGLRV